jgi:anti-sigma B factor antagonist
MTQISDASVAERTELAASVRPEPFSVEVRPDRRRVLIVPHGELDLDTVPAVATQVDELIARGFDALVIDLRATSFIDSSGVHLLFKCAQRTDARITVMDGPPAVSRIFDLTNAREILVFETAP